MFKWTFTSTLNTFKDGPPYLDVKVHVLTSNWRHDVISCCLTSFQISIKNIVKFISWRQTDVMRSFPVLTLFQFQYKNVKKFMSWRQINVKRLFPVLTSFQIEKQTCRKVHVLTSNWRHDVISCFLTSFQILIQKIWNSSCRDVKLTSWGHFLFLTSFKISIPKM